jgi:hypothetical protein
MLSSAEFVGAQLKRLTIAWGLRHGEPVRPAFR